MVDRTYTIQYRTVTWYSNPLDVCAPFPFKWFTNCVTMDWSCATYVGEEESFIIISVFLL